MALQLEANSSLSLNMPAQLWHRPFHSLASESISRAMGQGCTHAHARTKSCGAIAPPSGELGPLLGRAVRALEKEGPQLFSGAVPGQESARAALLRGVNALPRLYPPSFISSTIAVVFLGVSFLLK